MPQIINYALNDHHCNYLEAHPEIASKYISALCKYIISCDNARATLDKDIEIIMKDFDPANQRIKGT